MRLCEEPQKKSRLRLRTTPEAEGASLINHRKIHAQENTVKLAVLKFLLSLEKL
jgi:hypothetical protein